MTGPVVIDTLIVNNASSVMSDSVSGSIFRTQKDRNSDWISVKDFGVKGDGITDDTLSIQTAIETIGTGTLLFPKGTFIISSPIKLHRGIRLLGVGTFDDYNNTTIKLKDGSNCTMIQTPAAWDVSVGDHATHYMALENLCLNGNSNGQTIEHTGIEFWGVYTGCYIRNVFVNNVYGSGITFDKQSDVQVDHMWVQGCVTSGYAVDTNMSYEGTSSRSGYLNFDHFYVENTSIIKGGDPRNVPADRGKGLHLYKVLSTNINELHMEGLTAGVSVEDCAIVRLNVVRGYWFGRIGADSGVIVFLDDLTKEFSSSIMLLFERTDNCYFVRKATGVVSNFFPDRYVEGIEGGLPYDGEYTAGTYSTQSDPNNGYNIIRPGMFTNAFGVRREGDTGYIQLKFDWDKSWQYSQLKMTYGATELGSTFSQPNSSYKWFWRVNSYGNAGDSTEFNTPLVLSNYVTAANNISQGSIFRYKVDEYGVDGPVYQQDAGIFTGFRYICLLNWRDSDPDTAAHALGEEWINYNVTPKRWYKATNTNGSSADFSRVAFYDDHRFSDARTPTGTSLPSGNIWVGNNSNIATTIKPSGDATIDDTGTIALTLDSTFDGRHLRLGTYHLWIDSGGLLRLKNGSPSGANDGSVIGTQS